MTESSWPFDVADTTEAQFSYLLRRAFDTGVIGSPTTGDLKPYADSTGMFVKIPAGSAIIRGFYYTNDAPLTLAIGAAAASARVDTVVLRLDPTANSIRAIVKAGTPGSTSGPALTQTETGVYEIRLGDVAVPANATTIPGTAVTDRRLFTSEPWGQWTTATRPTAPREGRAGYNSTTKAPEFFDGSGWRPFYVPTTDASGLSKGTLPNARLDYGVVNAMRGDRSVDAPMGPDSASDTINGDWNAVLQPGAYRTNANYTNANAPAGAYLYGTLVVFGAGYTISSRTQVYAEHGPNGYVYVRTAWNGTDFTAWNRLIDAGDLAAAVAAQTAKLPLIRRAQVSSGGGSRDFVDFTFPSGYFPSQPGIQVSANTTVPDNVHVSYQNATKDGVRVYLSRDDGSTSSKISTEVQVTAFYPTGA